MWKISLALILIAGSATFFYTSQTYQHTPHKLSERTWFDDNGHLHVMGIVLEESRLRDAEEAFLSRADAAIFLYPEPQQQKDGEKRYHGELEAYFPSIADHSKVVLKMVVDPAHLETMRKRSSAPRIYPNGVIRMNLSNEDIVAVQYMTIRQFILIPSVELDEKIIKAQFGEAQSVRKTSPTTTVYTFPKIGLTATLDSEGKDQLLFSNHQPEKSKQDK
jgi:hypothetical protein